MSIVLFCMLLGLIPAAIARSKGYGAFWWWLYGSILFIVALPHALLLKPHLKTPYELRQDGLRQCPFCAEIIKIEAKLCRFCSRELPSESSQVFTASAIPIHHNLSRSTWLMLALLGGLSLIAFWAAPPAKRNVDGPSSPVAVYLASVLLRDLQWSVTPAGHLFATFTLFNGSAGGLKDFQLSCEASASSGTVVGQITRPLLVALQSGQEQEFAGFLVGTVSPEAAQVSCQITNAVLLP